MDSINQQQPEQNHQDLMGDGAITKIKAIAEKAKSCFFCTKLVADGGFTTRPMSIQKIDDEGTIWFLSATDSHKNKELQVNPEVQLLFQESPYQGFLSIRGTANVSQDKERIKELWEPILKTWFTDGIDDPRISAIGITPESGYYWDTKNGKLVAFAKQMIGAITGQTLDDSIEGMLEV